MERKTECEIVQDLLLGYVDETLNEESKKLVEKHLSECENCREKLLEIREDMKANQNHQKQEIDYLKKIRRRSTIKSIVLAIGVIILLVLGLYLYKFIQVCTLTHRANASLANENYYEEQREIVGDGVVAIHKLYYKDGHYKGVSEMWSDEGKTIHFIEYGEAGTDTITVVSEQTKNVSIQTGEYAKLKNQKDNIKRDQFAAAKQYALIGNLGKVWYYTIETDRYVNGVECYVFKDRFASNDRWEAWIDKKTGLVMQTITRGGVSSFIPKTDIVKEVGDSIQTYTYAFGTVTEEDVAIPDFTGYSIEHIEKNFLE